MLKRITSLEINNFLWEQLKFENCWKTQIQQTQNVFLMKPSINDGYLNEDIHNTAAFMHNTAYLYLERVGANFSIGSFTIHLLACTSAEVRMIEHTFWPKPWKGFLGRLIFTLQGLLKLYPVRCSHQLNENCLWKIRKEEFMHLKVYFDDAIIYLQAS